MSATKMTSRGKYLLKLALEKITESAEETNKNNQNEIEVPDTESDSEISLLGDHSSDDYQPDLEELSDSDQEIFAELQPVVPYQQANADLLSDGVVGPSNEDEAQVINISSKPSNPNLQVSQKPLLLLNKPSNENYDENLNFDSDIDFAGPSDKEEITSETRTRAVLKNINQVVRPALQVTETHKKKKKFSPKLNDSRKRNKNSDGWVKRKAAMARQNGEAYTNYKGQLVQAKSVNTQSLCPQKCRLKCSETFSVVHREEIFSQFYKLDVNAKNALLFSSIKIFPVKRIRKGAVTHKTASFKYVITFGGKQTYVCKNAFANLFCIGKKKIDLLQKSIKEGLSAPNLDKRGKHNNRPHKIDDQVIEYVKQHIAQFPAEESHYSRTKNIYKKYLSPLLSISKLYKLYLEKCALDNVAENFYIKECTYRNIFVSHFNLSFGYPKSDTCSTCDAGEFNAEHVQNYHDAYDALKADREKVKTLDNLAYMTMDLQQTMPLPRLSTSKAFYLRQLWLYNFGTHISTKETDKAVFCSWTEDQASRGSSEIFSCLLTVLELEECLNNKEHLVIWSDSCSGQNKNFLLISLYQYLIHKGLFKTIDHKFPEVGHTYLDSDRDFGRIEKNLRKHQNIYSPEQYRDIIAKSSRKNKVIDMAQHFRETEAVGNNMKLYNRKKDVLKNKVYFRDCVKWIRVEEYGSYLFKTTYDENTPFQKVNIYHKLSETPSLDGPIQIPRLFRKTGSIKTPKIENLKEQLVFVPDQHKWWYQQILDAYP